MKSGVLLASVLVLVLVLSEVACDTEVTPNGAGKPIVDLIRNGEVEAKATGAGITSATLQIRRLIDRDVAVSIPAGTLLVAHGYFQDMVTTSDKELVLKNEEWVSVTVPVLCTNIDRRAPDDSDTFDIVSFPEDQDLRQLIVALQKEVEPVEGLESAVGVFQAAVWIVTDNADYEDLGTLVSGEGRRGIPGLRSDGLRLINEVGAAWAMRIVDDAGLVISKRAIWRDRYRILEVLQDLEAEAVEVEDEEFRAWIEELRAWLGERIGPTPLSRDPRLASCIQSLDQLPISEIFNARFTSQELCESSVDDPEVCSTLQAVLHLNAIDVELGCDTY